MRVYRIEHENGRGICMVTGSPACLIYRLAARLHGEPDEFERDRFPNPCEQCKAFEVTAQGIDEEIRQHHHYAFPDLEALQRWFPGKQGRLAMQDVGFRGTVYEVPELAATGPHQIVFDTRKASKVGEFDLGALA